MKKSAIGINVSLFICMILGSVCFLMQSKSYFLSIAAIIKNEKPYLKEWLEYHRMQGVEHFYLCDNDSTDGTEEYLKPYIEKGMITYIPFSGVNKQLECYQYITDKYKNDTKWLAIIDVDEYMVPIQAKNMVKFLQEFSDVDEVSLHWLNYGDSGAFSRTESLITEFFTSHGKKINHTVKSIVRPKAVKNFMMFGANHYVPVYGKSVNEYHKPVSFMLDMNVSADKARINHYITKSFTEFLYKKKRGHPERTAIDYSYYFFHNENDVKDDMTMQRFLPELKEKMQKSPLSDIPVPQYLGKERSFNDIFFNKEDASQILEENISEPMSYHEVLRHYSNRHPKYH
jgi:hypothetical protein